MPGSFCFDGCCGVAMCNTGLYAALCSGNQDGVVITVKSGSTVVGTATTNTALSAGEVLIDIHTPGIYTVEATIAGIFCSADLNLLCDGGIAQTGLDVWSFEVWGCAGPLAGATVSANGYAGAFPDQITDANGKVYFCFPFILGGTGPYPFTITAPRFATYSDTWSGRICLGPIGLLPATGYQCIGVSQGCNLPTSNTLSLTDSVIGSTSIVYNSTLNQWVGTISYAFPGFCSCPATTVTVEYHWPATPGDPTSGFQIKIGKTTRHAGTNCATTGWDCPGTTMTSAVSVVTTSNTFACDPVQATGLVDVGVDCVHNTFFGVDCGCGSAGGSCVKSIWGGLGATATITLTDP